MLHCPKLLRGSFALFLLIVATQLTTVGGQFGEIASVITGLLGSAGTGAGLSGLSGLGSSAAGLAGAGATGAQGASAASGALSSAGQLYQLAQAALQLTGTGVGIANQASESAWFPVAVEHAAKMNRDFQERLLNRPGKASIVDVTDNGRGNGAGLGGLGGGLSGLGGIGGLGGPNGLPGLGGSGGLGGGNNKIGVEYGKEFESGESELETSTRYPPIPPSIAPLPHPQGIPLPGLAYLLPGETPTHTATGDYHKRSGESASTPAPSSQTIFGRGVPFTTPPLMAVKTTTQQYFVDGPSLDYDAIDEQSTSVKLTERENSTNKASMEFNVDSTGTSVTVGSAERNSDRDLAETTPHGTFGSIDASTANTDTTDNASKGSSQVPELNNLIKSLRASNLSREDFAEIAKQLESSPVALARENPVGEEAASGTTTLYKPTHAGRLGTVVNEKRDNAANRNLQALNRALATDERVLRKVIGSTANAPYNIDAKNNRTEPVVITLRRPTSVRGATRTRVHASRVLFEDDDDGREDPSAGIASSHQWSVRSKITPNKGATPGTLPSTTPNSIDDGFSRVHPRFVHGSRISTFNSNAGGSRKSDIGGSRVYSSTERRISVSPTDSNDSRNPRESLQAAPPRQNHASTATSGPVPNSWSNARASNSQPYLHNPQQTNQAPYPFGYPHPHSHHPPHNFFHPQNTQQQHQPQQQWPPHWPQQYQQQQQRQVGAQQAPRAYPARTLPNPSVTTPATIVYHPFGGHDALLTLMQPHIRHYHHQLFRSPTFNAAPAATLFPVSQFTPVRG